MPGSASLSTTTYSTARPPSVPPCCSMASLRPLLVASPRAAKVPVNGSRMPTLTGSAACTEATRELLSANAMALTANSLRGVFTQA
ncbi:hypothetical protein D3C75_970650 [compost metagenome]